MLDQLCGDELGALYRMPKPERSFLSAMDTKVKRLRVAFSTRSPSGRLAQTDCIEAVIKTAQLCQELGHEVEEVNFSYDWQTLIQGFMDVHACVGIQGNVNRLTKLTGEKLDEDTLEYSNLALLKHAELLKAAQVYEAQVNLLAISRTAEEFFSDWDVLITPTCLSVAPLLGKINGNRAETTAYDWADKVFSEFAAFTTIFNITGQPAMSVPLHYSNDGLPVGIQIAGRIGAEVTLIQLAAQLEEVCPWDQRHPKISLYS